MDNYTSPAEEVQLRSEFLNNRTWNTVNVDSKNESGKKLTFEKVSNFIQKLGTGLEAASNYTPNYGGNLPVQQNNIPVNYSSGTTNTQAALPWILGITVVGIGIAVIMKNRS